METQYFSFQGKAYIAERDASGNPLALRWLFDVSALSIELATETSEKTESWSGNRLTAAQINRSISANVSMTLDGGNRDNLALALFGTKVDVIGGTISGEVFPDMLVAGDVVRLKNENVSTVTITDSAPVTPVALVAGTDYNVIDAFAGLIEIINIGAFTQPFVAAYTAAAAESVVMFGQQAKDRWIVFSGINTVDNTPVKLDLYKVRLQPTQNLALINEEFGNFELAGQALFDSSKASDPALGGFGRLVTKVPA
ncbi:MAG: hypothetical protein CVV18_00300 [Gammaproteobacteria bacterium HGW-Gammaproteobacteria-8]|jgi:hypothetical protein|nr:MAG: hypothetical protein CVV18_00300 [Gammaproteobacteria bacterium HGW-Gammaproteobacteria-8]